MKLHSPEYVKHKLSLYTACNKGSVPIEAPCSLCLWSFKMEGKDAECIFSSRFFYMAIRGIK